MNIYNITLNALLFCLTSSLSWYLCKAVDDDDELNSALAEWVFRRYAVFVLDWYNIIYASFLHWNHLYYGVFVFKIITHFNWPFVQKKDKYVIKFLFHCMPLRYALSHYLAANAQVKSVSSITKWKYNRLKKKKQ